MDLIASDDREGRREVRLRRMSHCRLLLSNAPSEVKGCQDIFEIGGLGYLWIDGRFYECVILGSATYSL